MSDETTFDWVALATLDDVQRTVANVCAACGWACTWFAPDAGAITVRIGRIADAAMVTLQGFQPDQTHLRLHPSGDAPITVVADACYAALREAGSLPTESDLFGNTPRFFRPHGFRPRPASNKEDV